MNKYLVTDPWKIVEERFVADRMKASESLFSLGNGAMGGRANFEERYSGHTLGGNYIGGVYYPDKTRVGWWKNGYPENFAKVLNSAFWPGIDVTVDGEELDLAVVRVLEFRRTLDMRRGVLSRRALVEMAGGLRVRISSERFLSMVRTELGAIRYSVTPVDRAATVAFTSYIDADVRNEDANYDEKFWEFVSGGPRRVQMRTRKTGFEVCWSMEAEAAGFSFVPSGGGERPALKATATITAGAEAVLHKYVGVASSLNHAPADLAAAADAVAAEAAVEGFDALLAEHTAAWEEKWRRCDIEISGDDEAQQGIRYCIFQLLQTYTGDDNRLNIGPKGFTGEKYGGSTYWDTEAYCIPFYLSTAGGGVARQLLVYRYNQLDKAIENAVKLGFTDGAALYPMVTADGSESHNEWEITFEEIHRNGAIAHAIASYIRYTGDVGYLAECGLEVLLSIARFWAQRATWSAARNKYVILGVTGPNEYENNVSNNWYTNYIARWCLNYARQAAEWVAGNRPDDFARIAAARKLNLESEGNRWEEIATGLYLPQEADLGIFLQQDGYMDKEQILAADLDPAQRPLNQKWSWDRILRSCFIKQADVLQGVYFFEEDFDEAAIRRNFYFYEPRTVHESSLSPCVHAILAARLGDMEKAYEMYLRTARLDLDDYNREIDEGCHITSMAGSWLAVVEGFGGMRVREDTLSFTPHLPAGWSSLAFRVDFRGSVLRVTIGRGTIAVATESGPTIEVMIGGRKLPADGSQHEFPLTN